MSDNLATITIQGHEFSAPYRYAAGHILKENEAKALNQTFHENLRNNFASTVKAKVKEVFGEDPAEGVRLEENHIAELQALFDDIAEKYEFAVRSGTSVPRDPIQAEAVKTALAAIKESIRANGGNLKEYENEALAEAARKLVSDDPEYLEAARQTIERRQALAAKLTNIPKAV